MREIYHFKPAIPIQGSWTIDLISLEVYNSIFFINTTNIKFQLYTGPLGTELSYTTLKDEVAEVLGLSDISPEHLEREILGPVILQINRILSIEKSQTDGLYYILLGRYLQTPF